MNRTERAAARRARWQGGVVAAEDQAAMDRAFWLGATPAERLAAVFELQEQEWQRTHPDGPPSDLIDLLVEFDASGVEYLLVGGQAVALHGAPRFTKDAYLWLRDTEQNLQLALQALERFGAPPAVIEGMGRAKGLDVVWMGHPPQRIDLMKSVPGGDFDEAWATREVMQVGEVAVSVVGRDELIRLKRASARPQDLLDADKLAAP